MLGTKIGRWVLEGELGRGGFGAVYRVRDPASGEDGALKLLLPARSASKEQRERFHREVMSLIRTRHPSIARVLDAGEWQQAPYLVMELVPGESLQTVLDRRGPLPPAECVRILRALVDATKHVHAAGMLHRDLKPANVVLSRDGTPVLVDFGLARELGPDARQLTSSGHLLGSPGYWSPEQGRGQHTRVGPATDVWGLGATLHALLTGWPPHGEPESLLEAVRALDHPPERPSLRRPEVDPLLDAICQGCLAIELEQRWSLDELERRLKEWTPRPQPKRRWLAVGASLGLCLLAVRLAAGGGFAPAPPPTRSRAEPQPLTTASSQGARSSASLAPPDSRAGAGDTIDLSRVVARALARAEEARAVGDLTAALDETDRAVDLDRDAVAPRLLRSRLLLAAGRPAAALEDAARVLRAAPEHVPGLLLRGSARLELLDPAAARTDFARACELAPGEPLAWAGLGWVRHLAGEPGAQSDLERALALDPSCAWAHAGRAACLARQGDLHAALGAAHRACELAPQDARMQVERARLRRLLGDEAGANADAASSLALRPDLASACWARGALLCQRKDWRWAEVELNLAFELDPEARTSRWSTLAAAVVGLAYVRYELGDHEVAMQGVARALELDPQHGFAYSLRGLLLSARGEHTRARAEADRSVQLDPRSSAAHHNRGSVREAQGDLRGALEDYQRALELDPREDTREAIAAVQARLAGGE